MITFKLGLSEFNFDSTVFRNKLHCSFSISFHLQLPAPRRINKDERVSDHFDGDLRMYSSCSSYKFMLDAPFSLV